MCRKLVNAMILSRLKRPLPKIIGALKDSLRLL